MRAARRMPAILAKSRPCTEGEPRRCARAPGSAGAPSSADTWRNPRQDHRAPEGAAAGTAHATARDMKPVPCPPTPASFSAWHARDVAEIAEELRTDLDRGLSTEVLPAAATEAVATMKRGPWPIFVNQIKGGVILVLLAATGIMLALGHYGDAIAIGASVVFSVVFGFLTDFRAERALEALRNLTAPSARVVRGGLERELPVSEIRRGDLLVLSGGQIVAADGRIAAARDLQVDESALTGESAPVTKSADAVVADAALPDRSDMAYAGTTVVSGWGHAIVTGTAAETELGRIGKLVADQRREQTPLEKQAEQLGRRLALLAIVLSALVTLLGLLRDVPFWLMLETGVLLAIAAIPEGLPAVTTIALAAGVRRMAKTGSLVRRLASVETLGSTTVICTDKTGTLTENVMRVTRIVLPGAELEVTGAGYEPEGAFLQGGHPVAATAVPGLVRLLEIAAVCNDAKLESHGGWHVHGSSTEGALLALAGKGGVEARLFERLRAIGFSSSRKRMSVVARGRDGALHSFVKGSPEAIASLVTRVLGRCGEESIDDDVRARLRSRAAALGESGYRVLALAERSLDAGDDPDAAERDLVWVGMVGLIDPPRAEVREAIGALTGAGIRTVMVTGDQKGTAMAVARHLGIAQAGDLCIDSKELATYTAEHRWEDLRHTAVFARVTPEDKLSIVRALREAGQIVAMTGDGINDAPALRAADIGIAIGRGAADVARESSDLVVTTGNYATLPVAVAEGRRIYANIRRSVHFLLLCTLSTIGVMLVAVVTNLPLPMSPLQLLWLNLVVHIFPAMGLVLSPGEPGVMRRPPRNPTEPILTWRALGGIALRSALVSGVVLWSYAARSGGDAGPAAQTLVMSTLALALLVQTLPMLSETAPFWRAGRSITASFALSLAGGLALQALALYWPFLASILVTAALPAATLAQIAGISVLALALVEAGKWLLSRNRDSHMPPANEEIRQLVREHQG
ncbi:MAG TPA: cation-transporting P-type ATPase [Myxococcales bacterium]